MCGVAGIISLTNEPVYNGQERIQCMLSKILHRGPDRSGVFISDDKKVALGNTLLSIVDVGNNFSVPLKSTELGSVLSYNGEIFNYMEERNRLAKYGVQFKTKSDAEVLLVGLHLEGVSFLEKINGFWGFAFYNPKTGAVIISRDLMGEKHFFFYQSNNELIFASEPNAVISALVHCPEIDKGSVISGFQNRVSQPGRTLFKGISRLKAGCGLKINMSKVKTVVEHVLHRRLNLEQSIDFFNSDPSEKQVLEAYSTQIEMACRMRLPREVNFCTTLSGGLDSTLINIYSKKTSLQKVNSIFGRSTESSPQIGNDLSELEASRHTSFRLGTHHQDFSMIDDDCVPIYKYHSENAYDGLLCEGVACYQQIARYSRQKGAKVLIASDGPDELIGGYGMDISAYNLFQKFIGRGQVFNNLLRSVTEKGLLEKFIHHDRYKHLANWACLHEEPFSFRPSHSGTPSKTMLKLFDEENYVSEVNEFGTIPETYVDILSQLDISQKMALSYASYSIPDYFNLRSDRGSMRESVELRLPFLDPNLVQLMIATPAKWRFHASMWSKYLLRKLVNTEVGPKIAYRGKYGFAYPAWHIPRLARELEIEESISNFNSMEDWGLKESGKDFLLSSTGGRERWFAFCVENTVKKLDANFHENAIQSASLR